MLYTLVRAAKYLGVPPWDLLERRAEWAEWALVFEGAENWAARETQKRQEWRR